MEGKDAHPELGVLDMAFLAAFVRGLERFVFSGWGKGS
jgi:hypothetical protein